MKVSEQQVRRADPVAGQKEEVGVAGEDGQGALLVAAAWPLTPAFIGAALRGENDGVVARHDKMDDRRIIMDAASTTVKEDVRRIDAGLVQNLSGSTQSCSPAMCIL